MQHKNSIQYDANLIFDMESDHRELLLLYQQILKGAKNKNLHLVQDGLGRFKSLLVEHLLKEAEREENELYPMYRPHSSHSPKGTSLSQ